MLLSLECHKEALHVMPSLSKSNEPYKSQDNKGHACIAEPEQVTIDVWGVQDSAIHAQTKTATATVKGCGKAGFSEPSKRERKEKEGGRS